MGGSAFGANHGIDNCRHRLAATIRRIVMADDRATVCSPSSRPSGHRSHVGYDDVCERHPPPSRPSGHLPFANRATTIGETIL
jgi:hypothetical protein